MVNEAKGVMAGSIMSRHAAAETLQKVAKAGDWGGFPDDVTCEQVGRALHRLVMNSPEPDGTHLSEIVRGFMAAEHDHSWIPPTVEI